MVGWEYPTNPREASGLDPEAVHAICRLFEVALEILNRINKNVRAAIPVLRGMSRVVRCNETVLEVPKRVISGEWLRISDIESCILDIIAAESRYQRIRIDNRPSSYIDKHGIGGKSIEHLLID